jgi:sulfide:quinone oxidoreductase
MEARAIETLPASEEVLATDDAEAAMSSRQRSRPRRRVVIAGGGVAGVEALLALRSLLTVAEPHLIAPNRQFVYQPLAVGEPFGLAQTHLSELAEIAADQDATLHVDALERVDGETRRVHLASGAELPYDALILAVGARRRHWLEGALHFGGAGDAPGFRSLLERFERGAVQRLAFVNPPGASWTLPLYELALLTASHFADSHVSGVELTLVTPEPDPLGAFGPAAGQMLRNLLADRGIALKAGTYAEKLSDGELHLRPAGKLGVDEVVTLAELEGPALAGVPADAAGFIIVDDHCRVTGLEDVYAAGDGTTFPIKQGGIATQQADAAVEAIAAQMGAPVTAAPLRPTLRGMLLTGIAPTYLRARISGTTGDSFEVASSPLWWPPTKVAGRYLSPYLADRSPLNRGEVLEDRPPPSEDAEQLQASHDEARRLALTFAERDAADGHYHSAVQWLEVIERLDGVLPPGYASKRADWARRS